MDKKSIDFLERIFTQAALCDHTLEFRVRTEDDRDCLFNFIEKRGLLINFNCWKNDNSWDGQFFKIKLILNDKGYAMVMAMREGTGIGDMLFLKEVYEYEKIS